MAEQPPASIEDDVRLLDEYKTQLETPLNNQPLIFHYRNPSSLPNSLTFEQVDALHVNLLHETEDPNFKVKSIQGIQNRTYCGWMNFGRVFGEGSNGKAIVDGAFATSHELTKGGPRIRGNCLFGDNGIITRTLDYWKGALQNSFQLCERLLKSQKQVDAENNELRLRARSSQSETADLKSKLAISQAKLKQAEQGEALVQRKKLLASQLFRLQLRDYTSHPFPHKNRQNKTGLTRSRGAPTGSESTKVSKARARDSRRRQKTGVTFDAFIESAGPVHFPDRARPPADMKRSRADYDADVVLAAAGNSLKAGIIRKLRPRIDRMIRYRRVYEAVMRKHRKDTRERRRSTYAKMMAVVVMGASSGTVKCLVGKC